jgi:Uncharacterized protein conserved in cyanobacteria
MSAAQKRLISPQEYLERERRAEFKSEYIRGEVFAMSGATARHTLIAANVLGELRQRLKGGPCRVYGSDLRVKAEKAGHYAYPDVVVVCGEPEFEDKYFDTLLNPKVIVEVLSPSTENYDRGEKFRSYRTLPSLQEYVLVSQDEPLVERYVRQSDVNWLLAPFAGITAELPFESLSVVVPFGEIYAGVTFPAERTNESNVT